MPGCVIASTRFSSSTFDEKETWKRVNQITYPIYSSPIPMGGTIHPEDLVVVFEMNNTTNRIEGVGLVRNRHTPRVIRLYTCPRYNRYTYAGLHRISISEMTRSELAFIWILEQLMFYGKGHMKRGQGITAFPRTWMTNRTISFIDCAKQMFLDRYEFNTDSSRYMGMMRNDKKGRIRRCCDIVLRKT
jgi:hypothetical protein